MPHSDSELDDVIITPPPGDDTQREHDRIRSSNDRDQRLEREGIASPHNRGYDEAADGASPAPVPINPED